MDTLVISDLHLTHKNFSTKRLNHLIDLIKEHDYLIINGDLWCAFTSTFDQFYNSKWNQLFELIKSKNTIYVTGNHDLSKYFDDRIYNLCGSVTENLVYKQNLHNILFVHGHQIIPDAAKSDVERKIRRLFNYEALPQFAEEAITFIFGYQGYSKLMRKIGNKVQKKNAYDLKQSKDQYVITSHTHAFEHDIAGKYINTGRIGKWYASFVVINDTDIKLDWHYF